MNLLQLSRKTLEYYFSNKKFEPDKITKDKFSKNQASFVTLTKSGELRGCIGSLSPKQELWKDVIENSLNASFKDPRFLPLRKSELQKIKIEVSVLSVPKKLEFFGVEDLLKKINKKMGIILKKGYNFSTFLPQVWDDLPDKIDFLQHLSMKAGLDKNAWKTSEIWYYTVDKFKEQ